MSDPQLTELDAVLGPPAVMSLAHRGLLPTPTGRGAIVRDPTPELADRVAGTLVGAAIGSALGAPVEWRSSEEISQRYGTLDRFVPVRQGAKPGQVVADVQLLVMSVGATLEHGLGAPPVLAGRIRDEKERFRNPGNALPMVADGLRQGQVWYEAGVGSYGNGATVRAVAAGLANLADPGRRSVAAAIDAVVTHASAEAVAVSVGVAHAVVALLAAPAGAPRTDEVLDQVAAAAANEWVGRSTVSVKGVLRGGPDAVALHLASGARASEAFAAALGFALAFPGDPGRAIVAAVNAGGDADTVGALTGALAGAAAGYSALPVGLRSEVAGADRLLGLAERVVGAAVPGHAGRGTTPVGNGAHAGGTGGHSNGQSGSGAVHGPAGDDRDQEGDDGGDDGVHISFLLDRSGSMSDLVADVIGGFNQFCATHRAKPGVCTMTAAQFDSQDPFEVIVPDVDIASVADLDESVYSARGTTPLFDAIGSLIADAERRLQRRTAQGLPEDDQLVVVFTDGLENASRRWSRAAIFDRIARKQADGWTFVFLGANQDSYAAAGAMGVARGNTSNYAASSEGTRRAWSSVSRATESYRLKEKRARAASRGDFFEGRKEAEDRSAWR